MWTEDAPLPLGIDSILRVDEAFRQAFQGR